jgi:hypothetical protein
MPQLDHVCGCRANRLSYLAAHWDAERRLKVGQYQVFCAVCKRWRWLNQVGPRARTLTEAEWLQLPSETLA